MQCHPTEDPDAEFHARAGLNAARPRDYPHRRKRRRQKREGILPLVEAKDVIYRCIDEDTSDKLRHPFSLAAQRDSSHAASRFGRKRLARSIAVRHPADMSQTMSDTQTWPDLAIGLYDKLTGRGAEITYEFHGLEISVPSSASANAQHATWRVSGTMKIRTKDEAHAPRT